MPPKKKGEEMKSKSKGNFFHFVETVAKNSRLRKEFLDEYKKGLTPEELLKLFHRFGYFGVSLEDCNKILSIAKDPKQFETAIPLKY